MGNTREDKTTGVHLWDFLVQALLWLIYKGRKPELPYISVEGSWLVTDGGAVSTRQSPAQVRTPLCSVPHIQLWAGKGWGLFPTAAVTLCKGDGKHRQVIGLWTHLPVHLSLKQTSRNNREIIFGIIKFSGPLVNWRAALSWSEKALSLWHVLKLLLNIIKLGY